MAFLGPQNLFEHPLDVLADMAGARENRALCIVTETVGGGVRAPSTLMSVGPDGDCRGYVSGGCIDADVAFQAVEALQDGKQRRLHYGLGSAVADLLLPCGGAIHVAIVPKIDPSILQEAAKAKDNRLAFTLSLAIDGEHCSFTYTPPLHLRLAGRGQDLLAMARLAHASGLSCDVWSPDSEAQAAIPKAVRLTIPSALPDVRDDPWTAFLLLYHDRDWEAALLDQALKGPAFYVGAVGSHSAQKRLRDSLRAMGHGPDQLDRLRGPVGLIPSMRSASSLAISALAEIVRDFSHVQSISVSAPINEVVA